MVVEVKKTLVIHIGTEKTGSSSIQEYLFANGDYLISKGICALKSGGAPNNRGIVTYCLSSEIEDDHIADMGLSNPIARQAWRAKVKEELTQELTRLPGSVSTVIISSEHFHSRLTTTQELESLKNVFLGYFSEIKIVVYLRRQDEVAVSLFSTQCRTGDSTDEIFPDWGDDSCHYFNYENLLNLWSSVFGHEAIKVTLYDDAKVHRGGVVGNFFHQIVPDYVDPNLEVFPQHNPALSAVTQSVLANFNRSFPRYDEAGVFNDLWAKWRMELELRLQERFHGSGIMPGKHEAIEFYERFRRSNSAVAMKWFGRDAAFNENFDKYPDVRTPAPAESEIARIIFEVFRLGMR